MTLVGIDLNATRALAVAGPSLHEFGQIQLDAPYDDLPLALSLEDRTPRVGHAGLALARLRPHSCCCDFLSYLGTDKIWSSNHHHLDADQALTLVFRHLANVLSGLGWTQPSSTGGLALSLPGWMDPTHVTHLTRLAIDSRLPILGTVSAPLAAILASPILAGEMGELLLVIDVDNSALTWSIVERDAGVLRVRLVQPSWGLARGIWIRKLLDGVANRCVRQCRRDPRDNATTEQALFEQLLRVLDTSRHPVVQLNIQGEGWVHHLMLHLDELAAIVANLLRTFVADLESFLREIATIGPLAGVVLTHSAVSLPGLLSALRAKIAQLPSAATNPFDTALIRHTAIHPEEAIHPLAYDALAGVAQHLAVRIHDGEIPRGRLEAVLLGATTTSKEPRLAHNRDTGPARLSYRGQEHTLGQQPFLLGRDPSCSIVFASEQFPHVSAKHCEIVLDRSAILLRDKSRHGTLINDTVVQEQAALTAGDWIRLGPKGPVLRFLGKIDEAKPKR
jgi:hypothetical protein